MLLHKRYVLYHASIAWSYQRYHYNKFGYASSVNPPMGSLILTRSKNCSDKFNIRNCTPDDISIFFITDLFANDTLAFVYRLKVNACTPTTILLALTVVAICRVVDSATQLITKSRINNWDIRLANELSSPKNIRYMR